MGGTMPLVKKNVYLLANVAVCREVDEITAGNIAVVSGLKLSRTGDTVVASQAVAKAAAKVNTLL